MSQRRTSTSRRLPRRGPGFLNSRRSAVLAFSASLVLLTQYSLKADVRTDEKTHFEFAGALGHLMNMFGGKAAREA